MVTIGILDDGMGAMATLGKLKQAVCANYVCMIMEGQNFDSYSAGKLWHTACDGVNALAKMGCNAVVLSSSAMSFCCNKRPVTNANAEVFLCDAPVMHACTYTASNVLVVGDGFVCNNVRLPNVITCALPRFADIAQRCNERDIAQYVAQTLDSFSGQFDCIALANSTANLYKRCFSRVFPNVQIFDSLQGVARRLRKKYKNNAREEGFVTVIDGQGNKIDAKYLNFLQ